MSNDFFFTIEELSEGVYSEKRSKFLAFAIPVTSAEEVKEQVEVYQKKYYDARHVCYAYVLGSERTLFRANDNGEPSGTAGKPILGQINKNELTNILIIVVRYFGGIKLGTSGLIVAYRMAAAEAISNGKIKEKTIEKGIKLTFDYLQMNSIMKIAKSQNVRIISQDFSERCILVLSTRRSLLPSIISKLEKIENIKIEEIEDIA